jgi:hypothetical protein
LLSQLGSYHTAAIAQKLWVWNPQLIRLQRTCIKL